VVDVLRRPALAVLPLRALDADPRTTALASGVTEDLASLFARWCWFPVISTLASTHATWAGKPLDEVARGLGARFLVTGSVRATSRALRVSLCVDDCESSGHVFVDQRDVPWDELPDGPDALCCAVVAVTYPKLISRALAFTVAQQAQPQLKAWELAHGGMRRRLERDERGNREATQLLQRAIDVDPTLTLAHFGVGLAGYDAVLNQWGDKYAALSRMREAAAACAEFADQGGEASFLTGRYLQTIGEWEAALAPLRTAIRRNPSFAVAHASLAQSLQATGATAESLASMARAAQLGPGAFQAGLATLHFMQCEYDQAYAAASSALCRTPRYTFARALAAASAWHLGDFATGRAQLRELTRAHPGFRPATFAATFGPQVDAVERLSHALAALGRPA
jgi:adenylate cyclase